MRKKYIFATTLLLLFTVLCLLTACTTTTGGGNGDDKTIKKAEAISVRTGDYILGEDIDLTEITLSVTFTDGTVIKSVAEDSMLSADDREKFSETGVHTVVFNFGGAEILYQFTVRSITEEETFLATFFSNGGSDVPNQRTNVVKAFVIPEKADYKFDGWYTTPDYSGSKAVAPYTLTADTYFYAKWIDRRSCNVKFVDGEDILYDFDIVYGEGINIADLEAYPAPAEKEGKTFIGWALDSGSNPEEITVDTVIKASYENVRCTVQIECAGEDGKEVTAKTFTYDYGSYFVLSEFKMPVLEGHTSRWVLYRNDDKNYEEITDTRIAVTDKKLTIKAEHVINSYSVTVYNGSAEANQTKADLKAGIVALERVYYNADEKADFAVDYGSDFLLSSYTQEPYLVSPAEISGYEAQWCFVIPTADGEVWYNANHQYWDEDKQEFVTVDETTTQFELYDKNGDYIAKVSGGNLVGIKGDITIKPKYQKKKYTVTLRRYTDNGWKDIGSFVKEYLDDFRLYDPAEYTDAKYDGYNLNSAAIIERFYHKNNVPDWSFDNDVKDSWREIYFNGNSSDDYDVKWYTSINRLETEEIVFTADSSGNLGSIEIQDENMILYCSDIDLRRYTVTIRYGYNFETGKYEKEAKYEEITESDKITLPDDCTLPVTRNYGSGMTVQYMFSNWSDYPYSPDGNYTGVSGDSFITHRTNNVYFYAHYYSDATYTLTVYDKTQRDAYTDIEGYDGNGYDVPEHSIVYTVPAGSEVTLDMLFKGKDNGDGTFVSGQTYYERYMFINYFDNEYKALHNAIIAKYSENNDKAEAKANLSSLIAEKETKADKYTELLGKIYNYDFVITETIAGENGSVTVEKPLDKAYFLTYFMTAGDYQSLLQTIQDLKDELSVLENYDKNNELRDEYYGTDGKQYKKYADSDYYLNLAYGYDTKLDSTKRKYKFSGWYSDEAYSEVYSKDMDFSWSAIGQDKVMYAKWADEEKGTEGLVFREVRDEHNNVIGVAVVDFMNKADYEASEINGCGYNNFVDGNEYSINLNDMDAVPTYLGSDIEIQVPAKHGGSNSNQLAVIGILSGAFARHGQEIKSVSLPNTLKFIEEDAFVRCKLTDIYGTSDDDGYIVYDGQHAVYQGKTTSYYIGTEKRVASADVLIAFASDSSVTEYTLLDGTVRVGSDAFYLAANITSVDFGDVLVSIGDRAFTGTGITGSITLPDTVTTIGAEAFANCNRLKSINIGESSALSFVGKNAFKNTGWFMQKAGVVAINGIAIGLRTADSSTYDKTESGDFVLSTIDTSSGQVNAYSCTSSAGKVYYDGTGAVVKLVIYSSVRTIADSAFDGVVGTMIVEVQGNMSGGIGKEAFANCSIVRMDFDNLGGECAVESNAFNNCNPFSVYVSSPSAVHDSWSLCNNATITQK